MMLSFFPALLWGGTIRTIFASNNGGNGNVFDVHNISAATIELTGALEGNFAAGTGGVIQVWHRTDSVLGLGPVVPLTGWTFWGEQLYTSEGTDRPTPFDLGSPLSIYPGATFGFLVITSGREQIMNYTELATPTAYSDGALKLITGSGVAFDPSFAVFGQPPINPQLIVNRAWNGSLLYSESSVPEPGMALLTAMSLVFLGVPMYLRRRRNDRRMR
jgi:hypothetical protein